MMVQVFLKQRNKKLYMRFVIAVLSNISKLDFENMLLAQVITNALSDSKGNNGASRLENTKAL